MLLAVRDSNDPVLVDGLSDGTRDQLFLALRLAGIEQHLRSHGPMPIAILGSVVGGAFWLVSTPFCLLVAPKHVVDSFDLLVAAPFRWTIGTAE